MSLERLHPERHKRGRQCWRGKGHHPGRPTDQADLQINGVPNRRIDRTPRLLKVTVKMFAGRTARIMDDGSGAVPEKISQTHHYATLDGLRGVAAIAVAAFHIGIVFGSFKPASAYLAVDFFFVLSGFVLAYAYDARLARNLTGSSLIYRRVVRLFPLYLVGSALAATAAAAAIFITHDASHWTLPTLLAAVLLAGVMLPMPAMANLFPLNDASWSLFFEFIANSVYAAGLWRTCWPVVGTIAAASIGLTVEATLCGGLDQGAKWGHPGWSTLVWGGIRVAYSFPVGLLLYRQRNALRLPRIPVFALAVALAVLLCLDPPIVVRPLFDVVFVLLISPAIVVAGCASEPRSRAQVATCRFFGSISYPLYILHRPVMNNFEAALHRAHHGPLSPGLQTWIGVALLVAFIPTAAVADMVDQRVRRGWQQARPG